jgi:UMF1 family MFS transporter
MTEQSWTDQSPTAAAHGPTRLAVVSWALYDLANTIFSMNIVSLYFSLWVVNVMAGSDAMYGNATAFSMLLMFASAPVLGALSDQAGRRMPFLIVTTITCVSFTAMLGLGGLLASLAFFVIANYMFQAGLIFYDSLLPAVSTEENRGRIGGLGIGLGYVGSIIGVGSGLLLLERIGYVGIFRLSAVLFLAFAIPCFLFVKERHQDRGTVVDRHMVGRAFEQVRQTIPHAKEYPGLLRFLIGRFFYTDPANTVIVFMGIYVTNEIGFTDRQAQLVLLAAIVSAVVGGLAWGWVVDRVGPRRTLNVVLALWIAVLLTAIATAVLDWPKDLFWFIGSAAGIALGGLWAADRPLMLRLSPPKYLGEFYGLYSMVGRFAAVVGPFLWGFVVDVLHLGRPAAVATLLVFMVVAFVVILGVDDRRREWPAELLAT